MYNDYVKLSVSPNWLNWVRSAVWATYIYFAADHGMELLKLQASVVTPETFLTFAATELSQVLWKLKSGELLLFDFETSTNRWTTYAILILS